MEKDRCHNAICSIKSQKYIGQVFCVCSWKLNKYIEMPGLRTRHPLEEGRLVMDELPFA